MFLRVVGQDYRSEISDPPSQADTFVSFSVRHGEKQEEQSSQNMFLLLLYRVVKNLKAVAPDFCNVMCRVFRNYFMNNCGLSKCG